VHVHTYCTRMYAHRYNTSSHFKTSLRTSTFPIGARCNCPRESQHALPCCLASITNACAYACRCNVVMHMQYIARMRTGTTLPHISAFRFACPYLDVHALHGRRSMRCNCLAPEQIPGPNLSRRSRSRPTLRFHRCFLTENTIRSKQPCQAIHRLFFYFYQHFTSNLDESD